MYDALQHGIPQLFTLNRNHNSGLFIAEAQGLSPASFIV
jgi:hypothetical protein